MSVIQVSAGRTLLESYVKTPATGLSELIWNAFDEDARTVAISVEPNSLGGIDAVQVEDDGNGMTRERAELAFAKVGDSWKLKPGTTSPGDRPVHGRLGRGRYAAFALGSSVTWISHALAVDGNQLECIRVTGDRSALDRFAIDEEPVRRQSPGTMVSIAVITEEAAQAFEHVTDVRQRLLSEFALHLDRHEDFSIEFLGEQLDPGSVIEAKVTLPLRLPDGIDGAASLTVIEWKLTNVERKLYLCDVAGAIRDELSPGVQAPGAEFTAYVAWDGFGHSEVLLMEDDETSDAGKVLMAAREALRNHLRESGRRREARTVSRWQAEGVYPYRGEAATSVERATRDAFNLVAMASARTVDDAKTRTAKGMALSLLRETFERDPEALLPILRQFSQLPQVRIDELKDVLERTTLSQLIMLGKEVGSRIEFLNGLNALLFDRQTKRRLLERRQLHRMLAHETWIFGDEWALTGDDERLTVVLKKFLDRLGLDVDLAAGPPVLREDGRDAIPDLVLGRRLSTKANQFAHLVVELKRPSHVLADDDINQLRSYASAITNDERFDQPNVTWEFWLLGNDTRTSVDEQRDQENQEYGVVQNSKRYKIIVKTWAEIIGDAEHRLKFVQDSLQFESDRDSGLAHMRDRYAEYLPKLESSTLDVQSSGSDGEGGVAQEAAS